jgi:hypothetical protein
MLLKPGEHQRRHVMKRMQLLVLVVVCALAAVALGGEVLKDSEGRVLVPVAKLNAVPLFEVKAVSMTLWRVANSKEYAILATVTFIHNASSSYDVTVVCNFGPLGLFQKNSLSTFCEMVKPKTLAQARFLAEKPKWSDRSLDFRFTPTFTFSLGRE